ncbi:regulator of G-protein signaling 3-like [Nothobranchius furzeri]|uniref:regulator of G-protein signaling 3-like n=1 Tax=Nothobranchius furzeri TaxID=105023 RepID=UPI003904A5F8
MATLTDATVAGQLKLSIIKKQEVVVVSVLEARDMLTECQGSCDSYVKVGMLPDSDPGGRKKTPMVPHCRNPVFLHTFYFAISEEDLHKRLLFTVWNSDSTTRVSVLLGCTSFGMRSLMEAEKEVQGWYYLLGEELGRKKHLKVPTQRSQPNAVKHGGGCVLMWGCMSAASVGELQFIDGIMNSTMYCSILKETSVLLVVEHFSNTTMIQNTCKATVAFLKKNRVTVIERTSMGGLVLSDLPVSAYIPYFGDENGTENARCTLTK